METKTLQPQHCAAIILNYNGAHDTIACLRSLYAMPEPPGRVIVVDNHSGDGSPEAIMRAWCSFASPMRLRRGDPVPVPPPPALFLELGENGGYPSGNNAGMAAALKDPTCRAIWILNNDTEPKSDSLAFLCDRLNARPDAGLAGSTLVFAHDRTTVQCAAGFALNRLFGMTPALHGGEALRETTGIDPAAVEGRLSYISGASMLVRREVCERIGTFAEEYFLYYEDAEFCLRAKKAGYGLAWAPESIIFHKEGGASGAVSKAGERAFRRPAFVDYLALRNRVHLIRTYYPASLLPTVVSYLGVAAKRIGRGQPERLPLVWKALWDGIRGRMGKPRQIMENGQLRVLFLTLRADFGGGPEHLWRLLHHVPASVGTYVACPRDYPYYERYRKIVGSDGIAVLPHRNFRLKSLWKLRRFCRERGVSVLHAHGKGAGLYARLLAVLTGLPCVYTFHGVHMDGYSPLKRRAYRLYEWVMALITDTGIAVSEGERRRILAEGLFPEKKLRLIENGVNIPARAAAPPSGAPYTVVSMSRFDYQKNSGFLLDILESLRRGGRLADFRILVVGDGKERAGVEAMARERGLGNFLRCAGATTEPHVFFAEALCCISTSRWEGMPLALLEGMAHGLPALATNVVGNRDAVRHGKTGFLYPEGDADAAAAALCRLADEPDLRQALGERAREYVRLRHDAQTMADRTLELLRRIAGRNI